MMQDLNKFLFNTECITSFICFLFAIKLVLSRNIPIYMKMFFWYPFVSVLIVIPIFIIANFFMQFRNYAIMLTNVSTIFHFGFLSIFIIKLLPLKNRRLVWVLFTLFLISLFIVLSTNNLEKQIHSAFSVTNIGLSIICIIYYFHLFKNLPVFDLKKEPSFWIVTGVFFCMSAHVPIAAFVDYLRDKVTFTTILALNNFLILTYIIMEVFFVKAILCTSLLAKK